MVNRGRAPNAHIQESDVKTPIEAWGQQGMSPPCKPLAALLDQSYATQLYSQALERMMARLHEVDETLSAHMIADTIRHGGTWGFGSYMAQQHAHAYEQHTLTS